MKFRRVSLENFTIHFVYIVTFITIYVLTNNHESDKYLYTKVFNLVTTIVLLGLLSIKLLFSKETFEKRIFLLFFTIVVIVLLTLRYRNYINFHWIYLLFAYMYIDKEIYINKYIRIIVIYVTFLAIVYQMSTLRFMYIRPVINWYDPNYSGFFIFCFFLLLRKEKMQILSFLIFLSGFLTLSRNYIIAVIIYFLIEKINFFKKIIISFKINNFLKITIICMFLLTFVENFILTSEIKSYEQNDVSRLYTFTDASNNDRFIANKKFKEQIVKNTSEYQFGMDMEEYTKNVFRNVPHNYIYGLIVNYGFYFTFFFYFLFSKIYNRLFFEENFSLIFSLFFYYLFLGAGIQGYPGLLVFFILSICKERKL